MQEDPTVTVDPQATARPGATALLFAAVSLASLVPLWIADFLPFMDLPQHLAAISVLHHRGDETMGFAAFFHTDLSATPYLGYYLMTDLLAWLMPVETASRVFLSLYALLLPWAAWRYLAAHGREPALALLAVPLVFNTFLFMGFVNFVAALPFLLLGLATLRGWLDEGRRRQLAALAGISLAVYFLHTQVFLLYLGAAGLYVLLCWPSWRRVGLLLLHLLPTLALLLSWIASSGVLASGASWSEGRGGRNASPPGASWEGLATSLEKLPARLLDAYRDSADEWLLLAFAFLFLALLLLGRRAPGGERRAWAREHVLEIVTLALLALYFALPVTYKWVWPLNWRLAPVVALVALGTLRIPPLSGWRRAALVTPLAALALASTVVHTQRFLRFDEEVGPFAEIVDEVAPRSRSMGLLFDKGSGVMSPTLAPYLHFAQYIPVRRGGMADFSFANFAQSPVQFHEQTGPPILPLRWEWTPEKMRYPAYPPGVADYYDYYLVRGEWRGQGPFGRHLGDEVRLLRQAGRWRLFERVGARPEGVTSQ